MLFFLPFCFYVFFATSPAWAQSTPTPHERAIGTVCLKGGSAADFDALAQCSADSGKGVMQKAPLFVGKVTTPPYETESCDANKAGLLQWKDGVFQGCNGTSWQSFATPAAGAYVQTVARTSSLITRVDSTSFVEASADYRISITPIYPNSLILVEYYFSANMDQAVNTVNHIQLVRNIGTSSEVPIGVGPANGSRSRTTWVGRPFNGYDVNDQGTIYLLAADTGLAAGQVYTYGFKIRREQRGSGAWNINASTRDDDAYGFSGLMLMKVTEIAQQAKRAF